MADILIRGMEMPTSCADCPIGDELCCALMPGVPALWKEYTIAVRTNRRHSLCPLLLLPEGHGRLIDAGALLNNNGVGTQIAGWGKMFHETAIAYAPTIVPADVADNYVGSKSEEGETDDSKL